LNAYPNQSSSVTILDEHRKKKLIILQRVPPCWNPGVFEGTCL